MMRLEAMPPQDILIVAQPMEQCCYCWYTLHPGVPYPEEWSSTICPGHVTWLLAIAGERRERSAS